MFKKCALAAALGLVAAGTAHAQTDLSRLQNVPAANTLFISGASAPRSLIVGAGTDAVCNTGTKRIFRQDQSTGLGANTLRLYGILCNGNANSGASGQDIAIYYSPIGSLWGVTPVRRGLAVPRLNLANCPASGATSDTANCTTGSALPTQAVPDAGVSDLSKNIVAIAPNVPTTADIDAEFVTAGIIGSATRASMALPLSTAERASLTEKATGGTIFGVQVNQALRDALISRTGTYTTSVTDGGTTYAVLSKAEISSLMLTGNPAAADAAALLGVPAGDFTLCRRLTGSGTQAVANAYFLNNPTSAAVQGGAGFATNADDSAGTPSAYDVQEAVASSDVATCMGGAGYRMGILSIENAAPTGGGYLAINGVAPTKANVRNGVYDYYSEQVLLQNGLSGSKLAIFNALDNNALSTQAICSNGAAMVLPGVTVSVANTNCQMRSSRNGNQGGVNARR